MLRPRRPVCLGTVIRKTEDSAQGLLPEGTGLPRQAVHQVHTDVGKPCASRRAVLFCEDLPGMDPSQPPKQRVVRTLQADAQTVESCLMIYAELLIRQRTRIAFYGDLRILPDRKTVSDHIQDAGCQMRVRQGRGSASEKNADHFILRRVLKLPYLSLQSITISLLGLPGCRK